MLPNTYRMLERDHREIGRLLAEIDLAASDGAFDAPARRYLLDRLVVAASQHEAAEEMVFWPHVRSQVRHGAGVAEQGLVQETDAKYLLDAIRFGPAVDPLGEQQARQLSILLRQHISYEENQVWPQMREATTAPAAVLLGLKLSLARKAAPTRPHPRGPSRRVGLVTIGVAAALSDRMRDRFSSRSAPGDRRSAPGADSPDALGVLAQDHSRLTGYLDRLTGTGLPEDGLVSDFTQDFSRSDSVEREHLYAVLRSRLPAGDPLYSTLMSEHGEISGLLAEIQRRSAYDAYRRDLLDRAITTTRRHIAREKEMIPVMESRLAPEELAELGRRITVGWVKAPTRSHAHIASVGLGARLSRWLTRPVDRSLDVLNHRT